MFVHAAPIKTPLGQEELRRRSLAIGQRHRTVLFLVDGQRPLSEVLSLSHQAGALTSHFEELVRLGLVELPPEAMTLDTMETTLGALDAPFITTVDAEVPAEVEPPLTVPQALPAAVVAESVPPGPPEVIESAPMPLTPPPTLSPSAPAEAAPGAKPEGTQPALVLAELARRAQLAALKPVEPEPVVRHVRAAAAPMAAVPVRVRVAAPTPPPKSKPKATAARRLPARQTVLARANNPRTPPDATDERLLQQVRGLLIDTLRLDAPLFGARMLMRTRAAKAPNEMIDLVWKIEKHLSHSRHSRDELISLQRARELLGLGNTVMADDSAH